MKILLIEDDLKTAAFVAKGFEEHGHVIDHVVSGTDGIDRAQSGLYEVVILDRMIPEIDGIQVLKKLRKTGNKVPIILLTAMSSVENRVEGLQEGSDDYLIKPFAFDELYARVLSLGRRPPLTQGNTDLTCADLKVDLLSRIVTRNGRSIELQPTEFRLLEYLLKNQGRVVTRTMLLEKVWDFHFDPKTNVVETHISRLRSKIDKGFSFPLIQTVRGVGYKIDGKAR